MYVYTRMYIYIHIYIYILISRRSPLIPTEVFGTFLLVVRELFVARSRLVSPLTA